MGIKDDHRAATRIRGQDDHGQRGGLDLSLENLSKIERALAVLAVIEIDEDGVALWRH